MILGDKLYSATVFVNSEHMNELQIIVRGSSAVTASGDMRGQKIILKSILSEYSGAVTAPNIDIGTP
jgi:formylmethanofuran dehydrogenase subunit C